MPHPKRRHSKSRSRTRRSHDGLTKPPASVCPACSEPKLPHNVCTSCGVYKGKEVLPVKEMD